MEDKQAKKSFKAGDVIMRQGEKGDCAYIIETGQVEILIEKSDGSTQQVGTRGEGTIIGEMAIVDEAPRTATVKALKDCTMLEISRDDFAMRLKSTDPVIQMISQVILTRYRDTLTRAEILGESNNYPPTEAIERNYTAQTDVVESVKIANEFKAALNNDEIDMHYQPIIDLGKGSVIGFEALMRWTHKEQGFISPGVFIPIAEKSGLIVEASKWAIKESCAALGRIEKAVGNTTPMYMSVNFSSHDFAEEDFVENLLRTINASAVTPEQIKLEITERLLIQQPDNAKETLQACRDAGMGIAIDDFGTGYSSLSYLYYFPIEVLKIDQSFVRAMYKEERSLELVKSIIGLGKNMGLNIVAEGVEHIEEARLLQDMGCDSAQGYYFAKPMSEEDVIKLLNSWEPVKISA
ncbi:MAG: EAL domain-containing protein [Rhodospirillales bacterium]|nr:EAL domain-containing protein [Rhodospirillales bacterium]MCB9996653.1 EAL domain-containing protein [Rhodospirillales bacterium]